MQGFGRILVFAIMLAVAVTAPNVVKAQYMYLDANGDGINTASDRLNAVGSTTLDVWLNTNHAANGTPVSCTSGAAPLTLNSYEIVLRASGGGITWGSFGNNQPLMTTNLGLASSLEEYHNGYAGSTYLSAGLYKLATLSVSIASGSPAIHFSTTSALSSTYATLFGSECPGVNFDNSLRLGLDWFDVAGILTTPQSFVPTAPVLASTFRSFETGAAPHAVATGDLNADGRPDFAVVNSASSTVSILLAEGNGSYRTLDTRVDYATGSGPRSVAIADFDANGLSDLVTANYSGNTVSVLLGTGAGTFGAKADYGVGTNPWTVVAADLNGDGKRDLAVTNYGSNSVSVLIGNGLGGFSTQTSYATGSFPVGLAIGSIVPGGGATDLVVTNSLSNTVSVLPDTSSGMFGPRTDYPTGSIPMSVLVTEVDGVVAYPDLVVANKNSSTVSVLLGTASGSFAAKTDYASGCCPTSITSADFNADGRRDLAVSNESDNGAAVLLATGAGTFAAPSLLIPGRDPISVLAAEFNGDAKQDLAVVSRESNSLCLFLGNGNGTFGTALTADGGQNQGPNNLALGDVNNDGLTDVAVSHYNATTIALVLGTGVGAFGPRIDVEFGAITTAVVLADLNNDSKLDMLVTKNNANALSVRLGNGDGTFATRTDYATGILPLMVAAADFNGDGLRDLAAVTASTVSVHLGTGGGAFGVKTEYPSGSDGRWVLAQDVGGDGILDLLVSNYGLGTVAVLPGNANGTFGAGTEYLAGANLVGLATGDFNGDTRADIVAGSDTGSQVFVLMNSASGFGAPTSFSCGLEPWRVAIADLNGDGALDIVSANDRPSNTISVLLGNGAGGFSVRRDFGVHRSPRGLAVGNLDGAFLPDVAVVNDDFPGTITVVANRAIITAATQSSPRPARVSLGQNRPNPFNPRTTIEYMVALAGPVQLRIFDVHGRRIATLVDGYRPAGRTRQDWDGRNHNGDEVASGVYFYQIESGGTMAAKWMVLLR